MRAHFYRPATDGAGNLLPNVQVTLYEAQTTTLLPATVYSNDVASPNVLSNPWVSSTGIVDFYLDVPQRVRIMLIQGSLPPTYFEDVDVLMAGADSPHTGNGQYSLVIGNAASSNGDDSVALGPQASSTGTQSSALGHSANATGNQSIAIGAATTALAGEVSIGDSSSTGGGSSVALGQQAQATGAQSVALGYQANAAFPNSTAVGAGATTTTNNQIMMGNGTDFTEIPAGSWIVMTDSASVRWKLTINTDGSLNTALA